MDCQEEDDAEAEDSLGGEPNPVPFIPKPQEPSNEEREGYEPHNLSFSGLDQDPETYLRWERGLEDWFWFYKIPKEERLAHAINTLVGEAYTWWIQDEALNYYHNPVTTWGVLKQRMYREFVQKSHNISYIPKRLMMRTSTRVWMPTPKKEIVPDQQPTKSQSNEQGKSLESLTLVEPEFLCLGVGTSLLKETHRKDGGEKVGNTLDHYLNPEGEEDIMSQIRHHMKKTTRNEDKKVVMKAPREEPSHEFNPEPNNKWKPKTKKEIVQIPPTPKLSTTLEQPDSYNSMTVLMHLLSAQSVEVRSGTKHKNWRLRESPILTEITKLDQAKVSDHLNHFIYNFPTTVVIHLLCSKEHEKGLGTMEEHMESHPQINTQEEPKRETKREIGGFAKRAVYLSQNPYHEVSYPTMIKDKPPDAPLQHKPMYFHLPALKGRQKSVCHEWIPTILIRARDNESLNITEEIRSLKRAFFVIEASLNAPPIIPCQTWPKGKVINPISCSGTNLLYLHVGKNILRAKSSQVGGYDEVIQYEIIKPKVDLGSKSDEDIEPPSQVIQAPYVTSGPVTRTRSKGIENKLNIFLEHLEHEGMIPLDQFEAIRLTPSERSQLSAVFQQVYTTTQDDPGEDPPTKLKLSESTFHGTKDLPEMSYKTPDTSRTVKTYPVDPLITDKAKWALFFPKHEVHLSTCSLVLEGA